MLRTALIWASFLFCSGPALAEDAIARKDEAGKPESTSSARPGDASASALPNATPEQAAAAAYQEALDAYARGDLNASLVSMRRSYQLSNRSELLYNLAQLEDELKACSESLEDYRRYLKLVPHGRYREAAESARARLERECPPSDAAAAPTAASTAKAEPNPDRDQPKPPVVEPESNSYWTTRRVLGWSAIAAGTLSGAGALLFQLEAIEAKTDYQQSIDDAVHSGTPPDKSLQDRQHRYNNLAIAFAVTGGALLTSGALVLLLDPGKQEQKSRSARVYAAPGLIGAYYTQSF